MHAIPTRRVLVYIAIGAVVLVVGTVGLVSMRGGASPSEAGLILDTGDAVQTLAGGEGQGLLGVTAGGEGVTGAGLPGVGDGTAGAAADAADALPTTTTAAPRIWVQVAGAVNRPGVYQMTEGARVFEAILQAGGFAEEADEQAVALAAQLSDGCRVYVPAVGEAAPGTVEAPVASSAGISGGSGGDSEAAGSSSGPVSLNSATLEQLDALPGVGPAIAQQIIAYRENNGPFTSVDQLTDVPGIGPAKMEQLRPLVGL